MKALIPERFGYGSKITFAELRSLKASTKTFRTNGTEFDAAIMLGEDGATASTIDKVFELGLSSYEFAKATLTHCARDLLAVGAVPELCDVAFEFGVDLHSEQRRELSIAMCREIAGNGIFLGKIHSSTAFTTSITLSLKGKIDAAFANKESRNGYLILSDKIGRLREYYRYALAETAIPEMLRPSCSPDYTSIFKIIIPSIIDWTDISGFGILGGLVTLVDKYNLDVDIVCNLPSDFCISDDQVPECLQSDVNGLDLPTGVSKEILPYFALREVCGPMLCMVSKSHMDSVISTFQSVGCEPCVLGHYHDREGS